MNTVILTRGLPASGKTTWAKEQVVREPGRYKRISKDDLRLMVNNVYSKEHEAFILDARDDLIVLALMHGFSVIVDDCNLNPKHEARIRELVGDQAEILIQDFTHVPLETCLKRNRTRTGYALVPEEYILAMHQKYLQPVPIH